MEVFKTIATVYSLHRFRDKRAIFKLIILPSLTFKTVHITHLWIEEDLIYTSLCQAFGFDRSVAVAKAYLAGSSVHYHTEFSSQYKMAAARALTNFKQFLLKKPLNNFSK